LREALSGLTACPDRRKSLGAGARQRVEREFTADRMASRTLEVYRDVAGR
jgi:glycosyltransferase involved in cell wall biosynthesis